MTSPVETIHVECPKCQHVYRDWYRASINLQLDDFDDDYLEEALTAKCPNCGETVVIDVLVVGKDGVWKVS